MLAGVVDSTGRILSRQRRLTPGQSVSKVEDTIVEMVASLREEHEIAAVGIGAAGFVDSSRSSVLFSPHLAWRDTPLRDSLLGRIRLPIVVDNDANAAAIAECHFGGGRGHRQVLCITLGTGIGVRS